MSSVLLRWLGLATLLLLGSLVLGNPVLLAGAIFLLLFTLTGALLNPPQGVVIQRELTRGVCWVGDTLSVRRRVQVRSGLGPVFVHDAVPEEMRVVDGNNFRVVWKWPGPRSFDLSYGLLCPKRGTFTLTATAWEAESPLGLRRRRGGVGDERLEISVVPRLQGIRRIHELRARAVTHQPNNDVSRVGVSTNDFLELRSYAIGDPIRSINWKASARQSGSDNGLLVNRYEPEGRKAIWIFLDSARYMDVGTSLASPMEQAVAAASSLAHFYLSRGYTVGGYVYHNGGILLSPEVGQRQFRRITQQLLNLETSVTGLELLPAIERCKVFLFRLQPEVFIITRLDVHYDRFGLELASFQQFLSGVKRLIALGTRARQTPRVQVVSVVAQDYSPGATSSGTFAQDLMQWEARPLSRLLRRSGASVIEWNPNQEEFAVALLRHLAGAR